MVFILKDTFKNDKDTTLKLLHKTPKVDHPVFHPKPWVPADEIVMDARVASLKPVPIQHSNKLDRGIHCRAITEYNGRKDLALPRLKTDLKNYRNIC